MAQAAHASPSAKDFYLGLGLSEVGQAAEAVHWFEGSLANKPSPFIAQSAYYQLVRGYQKLNRRQDAQRALEQLKKLKEEAAKSSAATPEVSSENGSTPPPLEVELI